MRSLRPPGPLGHLVTGNSREFYKDQLGFLTESAGKFGDVVSLRFFQVPVYLLNNPEHIEWVFGSRNFIKPRSLRLPLQRRFLVMGCYPVTAMFGCASGVLLNRRFIEIAWRDMPKS